MPNFRCDNGERAYSNFFHEVSLFIKKFTLQNGRFFNWLLFLFQSYLVVKHFVI